MIIVKRSKSTRNQNPSVFKIPPDQNPPSQIRELLTNGWLGLGVTVIVKKK